MTALSLAVGKPFDQASTWSLFENIDSCSGTDPIAFHVDV